jgi:hypothetical protein
MSKNPPIRPGLIIKEALESRPMSISEMHRLYRDKVNGLNALRSRADKIHGATYWSFARQCQFAKKLGLIEVDHETPIEKDPEAHKELVAIRHGRISPSTKVIYRLTSLGAGQEDAWYNLGSVYKQVISSE